MITNESKIVCHRVHDASESVKGWRWATAFKVWSTEIVVLDDPDSRAKLTAMQQISYQKTEEFNAHLLRPILVQGFA